MTGIFIVLLLAFLAFVILIPLIAFGLKLLVIAAILWFIIRLIKGGKGLPASSVESQSSLPSPGISVDPALRLKSPAEVHDADAALDDLKRKMNGGPPPV